MPRGKSRGSAASHLPVLVDLQLLKALDHVLRQHILLAAVQGEVSPNELSKALGEGLSQVSYHVRVLYDDCEVLERTRTEPRRGATEHYYRASAKTLLPARTWRRLRKGLRAAVGAGQASNLFEDLTDALKAGKLQGAHDHITRTPLVLDVEGQRNVEAIAKWATKEAEDEQQAAAERMAEANGDASQATGYTFGLLAFEAAWEPANLHALVARGEDTATASTSGANGVGRKGAGRKGRQRKAGAAGT